MTDVSALPRFSASLSGDRVLFGGRSYAHRFPVADLDRWIAFYERMSRKYRRATYEQSAAALRALRSEATDPIRIPR